MNNEEKRNSTFPSRKILEEATIRVLETAGKAMSVQQINGRVIEILNLADEVVQLEDETGQGTMLQFRLRWIRTELKNKGIIVNVGKSIWKLKDE